MQFNIDKKTVELWDDGETRFSTTTENDLGRAVVGILNHPSETANKQIFICSNTTTQNEILRAFEDVMGKKWTVKNVTTDEKVRSAREGLANGFSMMFGIVLVSASMWGNTPGIIRDFETDAKGGLANDLLGVEGESAEKIVARVISEQNYKMVYC
jgi:hypothetical protein